MSYNNTQRISFEEKNAETTPAKKLDLLIITEPGGRCGEVRVKQKKYITIGKDKKNDVVLHDDSVSRFHAILEFANGGWRLRDNDSVNGIQVGETKVRECQITEDIIIKFGYSNVDFICKIPVKSQTIKKSKPNEFYGLVGSSEKMKNLYAQIERLSKADLPVFIHGETGSGKECVAHAIHMASKRKGNSYIAVNCAALTPSLVESELFGHEKGSFTGADHRHIGVFEQVKGGTLFLDEIGELPLSAQAKLLRVLEQKSIRRVGGQNEIKVDFRLITATHRNLMELVGIRQFREDLWYRLNVLPIRVPALRERFEDIPDLSRFFLHEINPKCLFEDGVMAKLQNYKWPGNVRELKNVILRAYVHAEGQNIKTTHIDYLHLNIFGSPKGG